MAVQKAAGKKAYDYKWHIGTKSHKRYRQGRAGLSVSPDHQGKACHGTAQLRERLGKPEYNIFIKFSAIIHWYFLLQYKFGIFQSKIQ